MFKDFGRRLQRDIKRTVDNRIKRSEELSGGKLKATPPEVKVISHHMQRYAVWFGGSMLASTVRCRTRCCCCCLQSPPNAPFPYSSSLPCTARVLQRVPHEGAVRGARPEHLPSQPGLWCRRCLNHLPSPSPPRRSTPSCRLVLRALVAPSLALPYVTHSNVCVQQQTTPITPPPPAPPPAAAVAPLRLPFCFSLALSSSPNRCDISSPYLRLATRLPSHPRPPPVKLHHWQANTNRPQSISSYARVCAGWHTNHSLVLLPQPGAASASLLFAPSCSRRCCSRPRPSSPPLPLGPCRCCRSLHRRRCGLRCRLADPARARSVGPCLARATQHSNTTIIMATRVKKIMTQPIVRAAPLAARFAPSLTSWLTLNLVCLVVPRT